MATAQRIAPAEPNHYVWWFPGSPVMVHLAFEVVRRLQQHLQDFPSAAGAEGLLFGRFRNGVTEILHFQAVAPGDIQSVVAALPLERRRSLVGYYRTEEGDFHLNSNDHRSAAECFPERHHVFLMIRSTGFGAPTATFLFHGEDHQMVNFAFLEFPFDASLLAVMPRNLSPRNWGFFSD
jgi:hypothetical protein